MEKLGLYLVFQVGFGFLIWESPGLIIDIIGFISDN